MSRDPQRLPDYLGHILEAIERIQAYVADVIACVAVPHRCSRIGRCGNWPRQIRCTTASCSFEHPVTNAYTESLNSLIRVMNRPGRGYSFEALRAKILFTEGAHKHKLSRPKFERRREPELAGAEEGMGFGVPPGHFEKAVLTPRKGMPKAERPHEPPRLPKNSRSQ